MTSFHTVKSALPVLGVGLGLRKELATETFACPTGIDWLELVPENYMALGGRIKSRLDEARARYPLVTHGVNLSIGGAGDIDTLYLDDLKSLLDYVDAPWFSDHFCFSSHEGSYLHDLLPVTLDLANARHMAKRAREVQKRIGRPLLLENISYYMDLPGKAMDEADFMTEVLESADIGLLLDVNNIYVNAINHNFDPYAYIDKLPLERVVQIHVAGHAHGLEMIIDTHGAPVIEPVFELLAYVLERAEVKAVMLERDQNYPPFAEILGELAVIREIWRNVKSRVAPLAV